MCNKISVALATAFSELSQAADLMPDEPPTDTRQCLATMNQVLIRFERLLQILHQEGFGEIAALWRGALVAEVNAGMKREPDEIPIGEQRALIAAALRRAEFSLPLNGERDTPMERAASATDLFIETINEVGPDATEEEWIASFTHHYKRMVDSAGDPSKDYERVHKSICRFKKQLRSRPLFRFDAQALRFNEVSFEEAAHGLSDKKGRPRKN
ncbi:MAG: hypothetical protein JY451_01675 [Erythrobacter sp.]|nr:MAG: hypothetical protein JY451_01675 [Erythrobacter sp.]